MFMQPDIDPVLLQLGPLAIRWYGLMYLAALGSAIGLGTIRCKRQDSCFTKDSLSDFIFLLFMGAVLGGRIGYSLFYDFPNFLAHPLSIIGWTGSTLEWAGMSFHGGFLGVLIASLYYAYRHQIPFWRLTDFIAPLVPIGLLFGRMGNFINGELWGRTTDVTWGVIFKNVEPLGVARHPSQLYEAILEGLVLFIILWIYSAKPRPRYIASGIFSLGYGCFRLFIENYREPDAQLGYLWGTDWLTRGMQLCVPMIILGIGLMVYGYKKKLYEMPIT